MKTSAAPAKPAADPSVDVAAKLSAVLNELKRGNLNQESDMKRMMDTLKKDIFMAGLGPVLKILDTINKLIAMVIMPFTNLIMPLLLPILYFLSPIVRFLNITLRPLFIQLMDWAKSQKGNVAAAAEQMKGGDISGAISTMVGVMGDGFKILMTGIQPYLDALLKAINIDGLIAVAQEKLQGIWDFVKTALDDGLSGLKDWWTHLELDKHIKTITDAIGTAIDTVVKSYIVPFINSLLGGFDGITAPLHNVLNAASAWLQNTSSWLIQEGQKWYNLAVDKIAQFFVKINDGITEITKAGSNIVKAISDGFTTFVSGNIKDVAGKVVSKVEKFGGDLLDGFKGAATQTGDSKVPDMVESESSKQVTARTTEAMETLKSLKFPMDDMREKMSGFTSAGIDKTTNMEKHTTTMRDNITLFSGTGIDKFKKMETYISNMSNTAANTKTGEDALKSLKTPIDEMKEKTFSFGNVVIDKNTNMEKHTSTMRDNIITFSDTGVDKIKKMETYTSSMNNTVTDAYGEKGRVYTSIDSGFGNVTSAVETGFANIASSIAALGSSSSGDSEDDFIQRPGQPAVSFNENDTIVGFKGAPPNFGGGGNQNITIRLVDSMNNTISSQRLQAGSGANMTFTV